LVDREIERFVRRLEDAHRAGTLDRLRARWGVRPWVSDVTGGIGSASGRAPRAPRSAGTRRTDRRGAG
jgi:hypothetical protein